MKGTIFIPDMNGFTNFVNNINIDLGVSIIQELLNEIIINNPLQLELSEIEGDAILYYKEGNPFCLDEIFDAFKKISEAFDNKYCLLKSKYNLDMDLSLKYIVHYGNINVYGINGFKQLYGEAVIESHRLLKNGANSSNYILITEDYFNALHATASDVSTNNTELTFYSSEFFTGVRKIAYYFYSYIKHYETTLIRA